MKLGNGLRGIAWICSPLLAVSSLQSPTHLRRSLQGEDNVYQNRVSNIDRTDAQCIAGENGATGAVAWTEINYYYAIHASSAVDQEKEDDLESMLYMLIQTAILWCTLPNVGVVDVSGGSRKIRKLLKSEEFLEFQRNHRRLSQQESRRMSIIAFNNNPGDETVDSEFDLDNSPCQFSTYSVCTVMKGRMGITAHASDNLDLIIASILDAIQEVMNLDLLIEPLCNEEPCIVEKIEYWGDNLDQVKSNIAVVVRGDLQESNPPGGDGDGNEEGGDNTVIVSGPGTEGGNGGNNGDDSDGTSGTGSSGNNGVVPPRGGDDDDDDDNGTSSTGDGADGSGSDGNSGVIVPPNGDDDDDDDDKNSTSSPGVGSDGTDGSGSEGDSGGAISPGVGSDDDDDDEKDSSGGNGIDSGIDGSSPGAGEDPSDGSDGSDSDKDVPDQETGEADDDVPETGGTSGSPEISEINEATTEEEDDDSQLFLFAAVPLGILVVFMLLLARNRTKRHIMTPVELADLEDYILIGTGDPPRSFHEGMYHYTRAGARYLSTNCRECHETRKTGMLHSFADLPTINENHLYNGKAQSYSYEDSSIETAEAEPSEHDPSAHRRQYFVGPSEDNLGKKASTVDVHQCTSATCRICAYKPKDVVFLESTYPEDSTMNYLPSTYSEDNASTSSGRNYTLRGQQSI